MAAIVTVTVNPALDVSTSTQTVRDTHKLRCSAAQFHPGGGGINVARVLHRLGSDCLALYAAGGVTGETGAEQAIAVGGVVIAAGPARGAGAERLVRDLVNVADRIVGVGLAVAPDRGQVIGVVENQCGLSAC